MTTEILRIDGQVPDPAQAMRAAGLIRQGAIVALPTETVYGLAVNGDDPNAVKRLYAVKERPHDKPFAVLVAGTDQVKKVVGDMPSASINRIMKTFWPGPLTLILKAGHGKVGLRMPDNKAALAIIREADFPVFATSANVSGGRAAADADEVLRIFEGRIDAIVDDGSSAAGTASTILDCTKEPFEVLREGALAGKLRRYC